MCGVRKSCGETSRCALLGVVELVNGLRRIAFNTSQVLRRNAIWGPFDVFFPIGFSLFYDGNSIFIIVSTVFFRK